MRIDVTRVWVDEENVNIQTKQGFFKSVPFSEFRLLRNATPEQRQHFEYGKFGIRWEELDEDLSYEGFFTDEELKLLSELDKVLEIVSVSYIAKRFFGKSRAWLHNKLNGNLSNGKPARLSEDELHTFINALLQMSNEMSRASQSLRNYTLAHAH